MKKFFKLTSFAVLMMMAGIVNSASIDVAATSTNNAASVNWSPSSVVKVSNLYDSNTTSFTDVYQIDNQGDSAIIMGISGNAQDIEFITDFSAKLYSSTILSASNLLYNFALSTQDGSYTFNNSNFDMVANGSAYLVFSGIFSKASYDATITARDAVETPIPAAVWLFGSALMGLVGASRRKSSTVVA